jgi:hypothetical protein
MKLKHKDMDDESLKKLKVPESIKKLFNDIEVIRVVSVKVDGGLILE